MPNIIWEGNQEWGKEYPTKSMPVNARKIDRPDNIMRASIKYGVVAILFCYLIIVLKIELYGSLPIDRRFAIVGLLLGFLLIPVHELLHAVCYTNDAIVYVGVALKAIAAYTVSYYPITKVRFILMSLIPTILGIIPLLLFLVIPGEWTIVETICLPMGIMGMITPAPDYMDVVLVLKQVPSRAMIQASNDGLFWYL